MNTNQQNGDPSKPGSMYGDDKDNEKKQPFQPSKYASDRPGQDDEKNAPGKKQGA